MKHNFICKWIVIGSLTVLVGGITFFGRTAYSFAALQIDALYSANGRDVTAQEIWNTQETYPAELESAARQLEGVWTDSLQQSAVRREIFHFPPEDTLFYASISESTPPHASYRLYFCGEQGELQVYFSSGSDFWLHYRVLTHNQQMQDALENFLTAAQFGGTQA